MLQAKPLHAVDNRLHRLWCGSLHIGIFNPQNKLAAMMAGIGPGIQGSTAPPRCRKPVGLGAKRVLTVMIKR